MTETEQKALELVNAARYARQGDPVDSIGASSWFDLHPALIRAIEAHESDKARHAAELREQAERFSEVLASWMNQHPYTLGATGLFKQHFAPFILPAADPLVEAMSEAMCGIPGEDYTQPAAALRKALADRGISIVAKDTNHDR